MSNPKKRKKPNRNERKANLITLRRERAKAAYEQETARNRQDLESYEALGKFIADCSQKIEVLEKE